MAPVTTPTSGSANAPATTAGSAAPDTKAASALSTTTSAPDSEKVLPLPGWLTKVYFIFPVVLYIPDALFNYYVYSDGITTKSTNPIIQGAFVALWIFLSVGVVGMAYLLSVLAPWHWGQGHRIQALFCGLGVIVATGITTWNSLAYRSQGFVAFATDRWAYAIWPQLQANHVSVTMILVAIAPPFWGLFWAIVQPTQTGRSLRQLQESHEERLLRMQQEAELKRLRAETNAKIREAQLRGMAQTAAAARQEASGLLNRMRNKPADQADATTAEADAHATEAAADAETQQAAASDDESALGGATHPAAEAASATPANIFQYPTFTPNLGRDGGSRSSMLNHAGSPVAVARAESGNGSRAIAAQPALLEADAHGGMGVPLGDVQTWESRRPATFGTGINGVFFGGADNEPDGATGTTGPRPAVRRAAEPGSLLRAMNEPGRLQVQAVQEAMRELNPNGTRRTVPVRELATRVAEKLNVDESSARQIITRVREAQKTARS